MKAQAEKRIEKILADVWGVEVAESDICTPEELLGGQDDE